MGEVWLILVVERLLPQKKNKIKVVRPIKKNQRQHVEVVALSIPDFAAKRGKNPIIDLHWNTNQEASLRPLQKSKAQHIVQSSYETASKQRRTTSKSNIYLITLHCSLVLGQIFSWHLKILQHKFTVDNELYYWNSNCTMLTWIFGSRGPLSVHST